MKLKKLLSAIIAIAMMTASSVGVTAFAEEGTTAVLGTSESQTEATSETSVSDEDAVAKIGNENYDSLRSAINNATSGQTVTLVKDVLLDKGTPFWTSGNDEYYSAITIGKDKKITLDLNHHSIKWSDEAKNTPDSEGKTGNYDIFWLSEGSELKVVGEGIIDGDVGQSSRWARIFWVKQGANLIIDSGEYYALQVIIFATNSGASATINGGTFGVSKSYTNDGVESIINATGKNVLEKIYGGTFKGVDPRCFEDGDSAVAEGCKVSKKGDTYTVLSADTKAVASVIVPKEKLSGFAQSRNIGEYFYTSLADAVAEAESGDTVTLLDDASGDGVIVPSGKNITIDLGGYTYNVDGTTVGSAGTETQAFQLLKDSNITIKNGTITSDKAKMLIQNYSNLTLENVTLDGTKLVGTNRYVLSNNNGDTVLKGNTNIIAKEGDFAFDCYYWPSNGYIDGVTVTLGTDFTGKITGKIEKTNDGTDTANAASKQKISISGGTFTTDVADYVADGYYQKKIDDNTYTVLPVEAKIIDTAKTTGATVTLDNLHKNTVVNPADDATYQVVVSTPSAADADAANDEIASIGDTNASKAMFDISVVKIDSNGVETDLGGTNPGSIKNQPVTLTLGETPTGTVHVYHVVGGSAVEITPVTVSGNKVSFIAPSFSTYTVTYNTGAVAANTITEKVGVVFSPVSEGSNQYYINLKSLDGKPINRFMSTDLVFKNGCATVDYDITPAANMTASVVSEKVNDDNTKSREYRFNMDGRVASSATGTGITIGTITFYGYGTLNFGIDTEYASGHSINIVNTAEAANNIVANYIADGEVDGTLIVNDLRNYVVADDEKGKITDTLVPETKDLTVNVAFNNAIADNAVAYQDMKAVISGGDLMGDITVYFGKNAPQGTENAELNGNTYSFTKPLTQNVTYTVTVSGAGYRTARYTVNMATDKTLNFWNNVMDNEKNIETGVGTPSKTNFLAGDIVKDNQINIYDLSAVVSYFGTDNLVTAHPEYARYDLNRDGKIDSKDVAYVLVSWNN